VPPASEGAAAPASVTAGPTGLDVKVVTAQDQNAGQVTATCPADHPYVIGGGGSVAAELVSSSPAQPSGAPGEWIVESSFGVTGQGNPGAEAEAICAK
jgi:threonine dehydratase